MHKSSKRSSLLVRSTLAFLIPCLASCSLAASELCLSFGETPRENGSIDADVLSSVFGRDNVIYDENLQRLALDHWADGRLSMRQTLVPNARGSERVLAGVKLEPARTYTLRQSVLFEPEFDWGGKNEGGKLGFGLAGGSAASGGELQPDGFTARFMWRGQGDGTAGLALYSYAADRKTSRVRGKAFGEDLTIENYLLPIGEWIDMQMVVTTNSAVGAADGALQVFVNDELLLDRDAVQWQSAGGEPLIDRLTYSTFYGGNDSSWSPANNTHIRFADVCWSAS